MKQILTLILACSFFGSTNGQNIKAHFTHEVEYVIPSRNSADTLTIAFSKNGRYLWTKYAELAKEFSKDVFKGMNFLKDEYDSNILFDSELGKIYLNLSIANNHVFLDFDIRNLLPMDPREGISESILLSSEKSSDLFQLNGENYPVYNLTPNVNVDRFINVAFDHSKGIDTSDIIKRIISMVLVQTNSTGNIEFDVPKGLILNINDHNGNNILQAINSSSINKTLDLNYSFKTNE